MLYLLPYSINNKHSDGRDSGPFWTIQKVVVDCSNIMPRLHEQQDNQSVIFPLEAERKSLKYP